jgi:hypothetical protein
MRSEPLDGRGPPRFGLDLVNFVLKQPAKRSALAARGSRRSKSRTFSTGRVFFHPDQRQMRIPLVLRMVRHVI